MKLWVRIALYIGGGGLIFTWVDPPGGFARYVLILLMIVGAAYLDLWLTRSRQRQGHEHNVVDLAPLRQHRSKRQSAAGGSRERRVLHTVYSSGYQQDVDELLLLLRSEGLNPMMVSQRAAPGGSEPLYEVRLPEREISRAKPLVQFFLLKSAKSPS